jgi:DNA-binding NtrC family response regulator
MTDVSSTKARKAAGILPNRLIIAVVCILCLALMGSALFTFTTLSRLRTQYLSNRGHEIAAALEAQARGAGRRNNPAFWQSLIEANYATYSNSVAFLSRNKGDRRAASEELGISLRTLQYRLKEYGIAGRD